MAALGGGAFRLVNRLSGKALDNSNNTGDQVKIIQWTPNGGSPPQWTMTKVG
ncbi:RICIN domain-containing protein [Streptomyces pseudovenezuelae]|uniref:RICIN domain-containing protein n=1 Tax=Streptomyces pseudovenezuelae TaxID=67350 RepID=UPI0036E8669A